MSKYAEIQSLIPLIDQKQAEGKLRHWGDLTRICRYLFSLKDEDLDLIRYHSWQLTGDIYPTYTIGGTELSSDLLAEYESCTTAIGDFRPSEPKEGIGFDTKYGKISIDLVRYLRALNDLAQQKIIFPDQPLKVFELGGGYGGLARLMHLFSPKTAYVICDQEIVLFFAGVYLTHALGKEKIELVQQQDFTLKPGKILLVPEKYLPSCRSLQFDLAISQQSLQEMTRSEVEFYCSFFKENSRYLYSCNTQEPPGPEFIQDLTAYLASNFTTLWQSQSIVARAPSNHWLKRIVRGVIPFETRSRMREILRALRKKKASGSQQIIKNRTDAYIDRILLTSQQ